MAGKDLLKTIIADSQTAELPEIWPRELEVPVESGKMITLSGVRRSGKTYHLWQVMKRLEERGVARRRMVYLNFEDERLELTRGELDVILQAYRELYPDQDLSKCYFLFDEIQVVNGWQRFIARLYEQVSKRVFITGSNAKLLSQEIATSLRGRGLTYEVFPLSFREYMRVVKPRIDVRTSQGQVQAAVLFKTFLRQGGFPELIKMEEELRIRVLQEYFDVMVLRDMIERYEVGQPVVLKYFCKRLVGNSGAEFSVNKLFNELKSQGYKVAKDTLYQFQDYAQAIYLSRWVPKYALSAIKTELSVKKSYVIDTGLGVALDHKLAQDQGRLLETAVALELIKAGKEIAYARNGYECDFVVVDQEAVTAAIQVSVEMSKSETFDREVRGLVQTCKYFNLKSGYILTLDQHERVVDDGVEIMVMPVWEYVVGQL